MRQKTFYTDKEFSVGDLVILIERENVLTGRGYFDAVPDNGEGIGGNMNSAIKRYHGWRGTTNDWSTCAHGSRRVIKVSYTPDSSLGMFKVTVGPDLKAKED